MNPLTSPARQSVRSADGATTLVVDPLAASLRRLTVNGTDLVEPTDALPGLPGMAGAILAPWPNRVEGARWWHEGRRHDLDVSEPELGNANHGLLAARRFDIVGQDDSGIVLGTQIRHPAGYPFDLDVVVAHRADGTGVAVATELVNVGTARAPAALGAHPYLRLGDRQVGGLRLTVDATHAYRLDERHIPRDRFPVGGTSSDLRRPTLVADAPGHLTLMREDTGAALSHRLTADDGSGLELWADSAYRWTQLYRDDAFPSFDGTTRVALAVEPMTAPPNALRTGEGLRWLEPGERWTVSWGIRLLR
ncbi:aldose epimerase [Leifsonia sp. LS-T14]|uniref:aldose epimerase family protein n=1 Tax=unclassified Leifsonia TaxID=2663824 RepID=UPI0035A5E7CF